MADVFISYARADLDRVEPLAALLRRCGWSVWWDSTLRAGRRFDEEIEREIAAARCVVVVWTGAAVSSQWVRAEAAEALEMDKLVPCFLEKAKPPLYFRHVHGVDLIDWDGDSQGPAFQRLVRDVSELAGPASGFERRTSVPEPPISRKDELQYAARGGTESRWFFGNHEGALSEHAWYDANSGRQTHPVGEKGPNPWGLRDVHGDVWEWCSDGYGTYPREPGEDPAGPGSGRARVVRGGGWIVDAGDCRSALRDHREPGYRSFILGFRLARGPDKAGR